MADEAGLDVAEQMDEFDQVQVNVWVCGTMVLRCVLNPFTPARIPYKCSRMKSTLIRFGVLA